MKNNADIAQKKSLSEVHASIDTSKKKGWRKLLAFLGPAYLISVGYMDPGNWATDIAGGSQFGYTLLWVLLMSNIMALLLQNLSTRLGIVRRLDLAQASRNEYPAGVNKVLWLLAEVAIAATDLAEVLGMAIGLQLLFDIPLIWGVSLTVFDTLLLLFLQHYGMRKIELFIIGLVAIIGGSFLVEIIIAKPDMIMVSKGFIPSIPNENALYIIIGIIGATVMPHNLYLHSALVQTRKIEEGKKGTRRAIKYNLIDSTIALNAAFFVNAAILILAASTFFEAGLYEVEEIQDAHNLLAPLLGTELAPILFGVALVAAGQSSTITGTLAGQIIMEGHLNLRIVPWLRRLITRLIAIIPAYLVILLYGEEKTGALLIFSQVILSLQLGFAVIPLIRFTGNKAKMGVFANKPWMQLIMWSIALIIIGLNIQLVVQQLTSWATSSREYSWVIWMLSLPVILGAGGLLLYVAFRPASQPMNTDSKTNVPHGKAKKLGILDPLSYQRIAITIDFSKVDIKTLQSALAQGGEDAHYLLIHVVESVGSMIYGADIADHETHVDHIALNDYATQLQERNYKVEINIAFGRPKQKIPEMVNAFRADLLVMGAHGHNTVKDLIFGTTVNSVRHKIKIPVLIIRDASHTKSKKIG